MKDDYMEIVEAKLGYVRCESEHLKTGLGTIAFEELSRFDLTVTFVPTRR